MTDTTTPAKPKISDTFAPVLTPIEPQIVRDMICGKLDEALGLTLNNNRLVNRIQESKNTDPENVDYQDATWRRVADEEIDPEIVAAEAAYQEHVRMSEELLKVLREKSRAHMQPAMSEEEITKSRKLVNDGKPAIDAAKASAKTMAEMADQMLTLVGQAIDGGVMSLMPDTESLLNARGRKSAGGKSRSGDGYATRIGSATIDGVDAGRNEKYTFAILADKLSERFNAKAHSENTVTPLELEEAFFKSLGKEFRDRADLPDATEFEFVKDVAKQNSNDDGVTIAPETVKIGFVKWVPAEKVTEETATEIKGDDNATPANEGDTENVPTENANEGDVNDKPSRRRK